MTWAGSQQRASKPRKRRRLVRAGGGGSREDPAMMARPEDLDEDANIAEVMGAEMDAQYEQGPQDEVDTSCGNLLSAFFALNLHTKIWACCAGRVIMVSVEL